MATEDQWLIDEMAPAGTAVELAVRGETSRSIEEPREAPHLAVRIRDMVIHDTGKWFGEAEIRVDALVVHGNASGDGARGFYMPGTFVFAGMRDGQHLPLDTGGLLIFHGRPRHFLDIFVTVSRNRRDTDDLASLLAKRLPSTEMQGAVQTLLGLAVAAPPAATVTAALGAATTVGHLAYQVLQQTTGATIGLYRTAWLQHRDDFGIGRHPLIGWHRARDLSFWYEIVPNEPPAGG